jgi:hypothetical protein
MVSRFLNSVISWLRAGYPEGVPPTDTFALLALLSRRLTDDEIKAVTKELIHRGEFDSVDIGVRITQIKNDLPSPEEIERVRARLAVKGWPLDDERDVGDPA